MENERVVISAQERRQAQAYAASRLEAAGVALTPQERDAIEVADFGLSRLRETGLFRAGPEGAVVSEFSSASGDELDVSSDPGGAACDGRARLGRPTHEQEARYRPPMNPDGGGRGEHSAVAAEG